jgi:hypothetical protein
LLGEATADELLSLHQKIVDDPKAKPQSHGSVKFPQISDKETRTRIHSVRISVLRFYLPMTDEPLGNTSHI